QKLGAYCLSEPVIGSDATQQATTATLQADGSYLLNGAKNWITNGTMADHYIVFAQSDPTKTHKGITAFLIDKGMPGFEIGLKEDKLGIRSSDTCSLGFTDVKASSDRILGAPGQGFKIAMETLNGGRIGIADKALGIASGAFEQALRY